MTGIADAHHRGWTVEGESRDERGRKTITRTHVEELRLLGDEGEELFAIEQSSLLGASLAGVAADVTRMLSGADRTAAVRWNVAWPPFLVASLLALVAGSNLSTRIGLALRDRGLLPQSLHLFAFYWAPAAVMLALLMASWTLALLGADPPGWLAAMPGLS